MCALHASDSQFSFVKSARLLKTGYISCPDRVTPMRPDAGSQNVVVPLFNGPPLPFTVPVYTP
jgi:hypothetical protein